MPRRGKLDFSFEVVRLWEIPVDRILKHGLGVLPLAPLAKLPDKGTLNRELSRVIESVIDRIVHEAADEEARTLLTATYILTGMRLPKGEALQLFSKVKAMKESSTYQAILEEGREEGREGAMRDVVLDLGTSRFGVAPAGIRTRLESIKDVERLQELYRRVGDVESWHALLAE